MSLFKKIDQDAINKLRRARIEMLDKHPFWGCLAFNLRLVEDSRFDTCATNGSEIRYNPKYIKELSFEKLKGMLAHEAAHVAFGHPFRMGKRDPKLANYCMDLAINPILMDNGFELPDGPCVTRDYAGQVWEDIYEQMKQNPPPQCKQGSGKGGSGKGDNEDPGGCGGVMAPTDEDGNELSQSEMRMAEQEAQENTSQAMMVAKQQGKMPAEVERMIGDTVDPPITWQDKLARFMHKTIVVDYTWQRPNRRIAAALGIYMPSMKREGIGEVVIVVDTSGSVDDQQVALFFKNINKLVEECAPDVVHVMACDARVHSVDTFMKGEEIKPRILGRGGTDFRPPFKKIEEMGINPLCLIYFTDLAGTFPERPAEFPVLWATTEHSGRAPWGETIRLNKVE